MDSKVACKIRHTPVKSAYDRRVDGERGWRIMPLCDICAHHGIVCTSFLARIMNREIRVDYSREISLLSIRGKIGDSFPTVRPKLLCLNFFKTHADA